MNKCFIITAYINGGISEKFKLNIKDSDFIICADGGYKLAKEEQIKPHLIIGDFDSFNGHLPEDIDRITYPSEKDDTDTMLCVKYAVDRGFDEIHIVGGMGGRLDHTLSNLQSMSWAIDFWHNHNLNNKKISMQDYQNHVMLIMNSSIEISGNPKEKISLISYSNTCTGVTTTNLKWELINAELSNSFPLGISNEFLSSTCKVSVANGKLLLIRSID